MIIEIKKPITPKAATPIAEIFETVRNSSLVGFLSECQTLLHLMKNIFTDSVICAMN